MKTCISRARLAVLPLALAAAFPVLSQDATPTLKEVVVTANRLESRADALISDLTVIGHDEIERGTGRSLAELLARVAGIRTSSNGGLGKQSNLYIRGTENKHVLFLVDGVRYGSVTSGVANFDTIPLEAIDHIEVLKGPASALYGSEAVGGVVQIFTRTGKTGFHPYATVTAGENERTELATGFSGGTPAIGYSLGVQTLREKGFSATNRRIAASTFNPDADGYSQNSVNGSVKWKIANDWTLDARALQSDGVSQSDSGPSAFDVHSDTTTSVYGLGLEGRVSQSWKTRLSLGNSTDKNAYYTSVNPSRFKTEQNQSAWQNDFATPLGVLMVGVENLVQSVSGTQAYKVTSRTNDSVFVGLNGESGAHSWQFNVRGDQNSQFGHADTWLTGYGYRLTPELRIHGSVGTSFNVPSFNQLYWVSAKPTDYQGNPTTQPESGRNTELGAAYAVGDQQVSLTYFANRIQGFITTQPVVLNTPFARIEGWTLAYEGSTHGWSYRAALDTLDARNELTQLKLTRRPDLQFTSSVLYATGPWELGASLLTVSEAFDNTANTTTLGGYGTVDLSVRYAVNKDWSVAGRVVNLGDKFYQTATGYNQPGRSAYVTLQYTPK